MTWRAWPRQRQVSDCVFAQFRPLPRRLERVLGWELDQHLEYLPLGLTLVAVTTFGQFGKARHAGALLSSSSSHGFTASNLGRGISENRHSTDVDYPPPPPYTSILCASVRAFTLKVSHAPMSVECLLSSMTLLSGYGGWPSLASAGAARGLAQQFTTGTFASRAAVVGGAG